jgi:hypothetical protein
MEGIQNQIIIVCNPYLDCEFLFRIRHCCSYPSETDEKKGGNALEAMSARYLQRILVLYSYSTCIPNENECILVRNKVFPQEKT